MIKWLRTLWSDLVFEERAFNENHPSEFEERIRNLKRRIEEQRKWIGYYTPQPGTSSEFTKVEQPIQDVERLQKNAELDALKAKLKPKNT